MICDYCLHSSGKMCSFYGLEIIVPGDICDGFEMKEMDQEYYLLSIEHTPKTDLCVWWKPSEQGYTLRLEKAGKYTGSYIRERGLDEGIRRGVIRAILCHIAEEYSCKVVLREKYGVMLSNSQPFDIDTQA